MLKGVFHGSAHVAAYPFKKPHSHVLLGSSVIIYYKKYKKISLLKAQHLITIEPLTRLYHDDTQFRKFHELDMNEKSTWNSTAHLQINISINQCVQPPISPT